MGRDVGRALGPADLFVVPEAEVDGAARAVPEEEEEEEEEGEEEEGRINTV